MKKEFRAVQLSSVAEVAFSSVDKISKSDELSVQLCNYTDVYYNRRIHSGMDFMRGTATQAEIKKFRLQAGDVVITKDSESPEDIAVPAYISETITDLVCGYHLAIIRPKSKLLDGRYLTQLLQLQKIRHYFFTLSNGATRFGLGIEMIRMASFDLPSISEQRKIADILSTWDEALENLDSLIVAKNRQKQALMQQLLTGKTRVKGAKGKWKKVHLGELAENRSDQNKGKFGTELLYGVTKADGVVPMRDHVKGESFHRCKLLEHDWFAYNPMRINIGSIARWQGNKTVMVSGDYVVFRCFENRLSPAYLDHLRQSWMWHSFVTQGGNGSVRIRIYFSDLAEFTFPCPPIEEQQRIATILDTADQELTLLRTQRQSLDQQKRGLMQRLLTGKIRVKIK